ncbi:hypothetical protein [Verminephrobacter aporrectodeae]|uniref:hypothetical protein n=1 Tax=Verminephrobacter aporrectodeae TaxID=1110389 RepID=UPI0002D8D0D0|nr:hypothetical protein [Verminephrobacter aporrectodeae]
MIKTLLTLMLLVGALLTACGDGDGVQTQPPDAAPRPSPRLWEESIVSMLVRRK